MKRLTGPQPDAPSELAKSGGIADILPKSRMSGPMPWVTAIMVALTVIAVAAGLAMRKTVRHAAADLSGGITVQIVEASPERRAAQAKAGVEMLRSLPGIVAVRAVPEREVANLIGPWIDTGGDAVEAIPVPAMIDAQVEGKVTSERLTLWQNRLRSVAPAARVDAQAQWLQPVFGAIRSLQWLAMALAALLGFAMSAAVLLAVRMGLGANRETIETVHLLGGTDGQIARVFQRSTAVDAAAGGAVGFLLGLVAVLALGRQFAALGAGLVDQGALGPTEWIVLLLVPVIGVVLATLTARVTVLRTLAKML